MITRNTIARKPNYQLKNYPEVTKSITQIFNQQLLSPMTGPAAAIGVSAYLDSGNPKQAFDLVKKYFDKIPQPQATFLLARCLLLITICRKPPNIINASITTTRIPKKRATPLPRSPI